MGESLTQSTCERDAPSGTTKAIRVIDPNGRLTGDLAALPGNDLVPTHWQWESPTWSPDGSRLAFHGSRYGKSRGVYVANRNGTGLRRLSPGEAPAWSPDGRWIAFRSGYLRSGNWDLFLIHPDGTGCDR